MQSSIAGIRWKSLDRNNMRLFSRALQRSEVVPTTRCTHDPHGPHMSIPCSHDPHVSNTCFCPTHVSNFRVQTFIERQQIYMIEPRFYPEMPAKARALYLRKLRGDKIGNAHLRACAISHLHFSCRLRPDSLLPAACIKPKSA